MSPVAICSELRGQVFHLVGQYAIFGEEMPFIGVWFERDGQQRHVGLFGGHAVLEPIAAFARGDNIFPFIGPPSGGRHHMIASQLGS